ncbi:MAG TPA: hypothetical protein VMT70_21840 [Vicinamibacteria bacterium]|nr:hypothetical protein [Vicinamibacteria bacterium]
MASAGATVPTISVIDAAHDAIAHVRRHLFPIRVERWLVLGLLAFLDQCGRGGGGGTGRGLTHHTLDWSRGPWPQGPGDFPGALVRVSEWLSLHAVVVALGLIATLVVLGGVAAVVLWVNARGSFMYLDNVASGRADVVRPWREHASASSSYFVWRLGLTLAAAFVAFFAAGLVLAAVLGWARGNLEGATGLVAGLALLPVVLLLGLALPLLLLAGLALRDFVAPLQLITGLPCPEAARILEGLLTQHPGAFILYLLAKLGLLVGSGVVVVAGGCLTCCIGFLPVVMQTLFQPLFYFERAFPLFLLRQMGHDLPGRLGGLGQSR